MSENNRGVVYLEPGKVDVQRIDFPKMQNPQGRSGVPLEKDGQVVGAIGVSGGSGEQDHAVAEAGAAAF